VQEGRTRRRKLGWREDTEKVKRGGEDTKKRGGGEDMEERGGGEKERDYEEDDYYYY
jgi:hypothetical protein